MHPQDAVPRPADRAERPAALHPLVGLPVGAALLPRAQARVLRGAQRRRDLRHLAAVQVPDHRSGRRGVPVAHGRARPGRDPAGARGVHAVVRRPGLRDGGRRPVLPVRAGVAADVRATGAELVRRPPARAAGRDRGRERRLRHAPGPGAALAGGAVRRSRPRSRSCRTSGSPTAKIGSVPVTVSRTGYTGDLGFELMVPADDAVTVLDAVLDGGRAARHPAVRRGGAQHAAHRGRPARWSTWSGTTAGPPGPTTSG